MIFERQVNKRLPAFCRRLLRADIFKIIRSKRRSLALEISADARLIVRAPFFVNEQTIYRFVAGKRRWILRKQKQVLARRQSNPLREFRDGEIFFYLGKEYKLYLRDNLSVPLSLANEFLLLRDYRHKAKELFIRWYAEQARLLIPGRVAFFCSLAGLQCVKIVIKDAKSRWGSCGKNGGLYFSWRLMMAPIEVVDYVVAHEVAHLAVRNHSRNFWMKVAELFPDYKRCKSWLRKNGPLLII